MATLLCAAHDPGGARYLSAVARAARARGDTVVFLGAGPARELWSGEGETVLERAENLPQSDLLITGTGFGDFERSLWGRGKALAVIDAWTNFTLRFVSANGTVTLPDAIAVIDEDSRSRISRKSWCTSPVYVAGQPHLEIVIPQIISARRQRTGASRQVVFFSEPIDVDFGREVRGYDQYEIATALAETLKGSEILIKPHPREQTEVWRERMAPFDVNVTEQDAAQLLHHADGVLGMTTMVLLEAGLAGVPCLSLQMGRLMAGNPVVDRYVPYVTEASQLEDALRLFVAKFGSAEHPIHPELFEGAAEKCLAAIDACLESPNASL